MNWRDHLPIHPAAELFPLMAEAELQTLAEDIKVNGLNVPVICWEPLPDDDDTDAQLIGGEPRRFNVGQLIDGRNRLDAMALAGLLKVNDQGKFYPPGGARLVHGDPYDIVLSLNIHRRHLTPEQKRELIAKLIKANPEKSNRQIAGQVKASHPHVAKVRTELEKTGDVETVSTSIDTKGRRQPAKRKAKTAVSKAAEPEPSVEASATARRAYYAATEELTDKPEHKAPSVKDIALSEFNNHVLRLLQITSKANPERFAKTTVRASDLSQLGRFLAGVLHEDQDIIERALQLVRQMDAEQQVQFRTKLEATYDAEMPAAEAVL